MSGSESSKYVSWTVLSLFVTILVIVLGIIWQTLSGVKDDVTLVKVDSAISRTKIENIEALLKGYKTTSTNLYIRSGQ